jgi:hypothetical protein
MHRTARGNRIGLAIVGTLLLLAGLAALLRAADVIPEVLGGADAAVLDPRLRDVAADQPWFWVVLAVVLLVVAVLALRWLGVQARSDAVRHLRLESDVRRGSTRMPAAAVTGALADDLSASPYLRGVQATLNGGPSRPRLKLSVTMDPAAEPAAVLDRTYEALDRYGQALEVSEARALVTFRVSG